MKQVSIIKKPLITEKSLLLANEGKYTFLIDSSATKSQVKQFIKTYFDIEVDSISTLTMKGGSKRVPGRREKTTVANSKKAIVTLRKGQKISTFQQWFSLEDNQDEKKTTVKKERQTAKK